MSDPSTSIRGIADHDPALTAVVAYETTTGQQRRICFYNDDDGGTELDRVEQRYADGQWRTVGRERLTSLTLQLIDADAARSTQEGVER